MSKKSLMTSAHLLKTRVKVSVANKLSLVPSDEMLEVCSILNVETMTTAAESPFQNGLCERNHTVIDNMLTKMEEQCPDTPIEVLLCWASMEKNTLQMNHGFSC